LFSQTRKVNDKYYYKPEKINYNIKIDGDLDEACWNTKNVIEKFIQREPRDGTQPSEKTDVIITYNEDYIYISAKLFDSEPDKIISRSLERDNFAITKDDQFVFTMDTYNDERNGYWFSTNPAAAKVDAQIQNEGEIFNENWDGVWYVETSKNNYGWFAEIAIPISTLRFNEGERVIFGFNFFRRIVRKNEALFFPPMPRDFLNGTSTFSRAMKVEFSDFKESIKYQILPYALSSYQNNVLQTGTESKLNFDAGIDAKIPLSSNLVADLTINTDFAHVEADDHQINFSRNQLFFPEKRTFFLENSGYFEFGKQFENQPFYSRRIGLSNNEKVPIIAGGRVSGKFGNFGLGFLDIQTAKHSQENSTNFSVLRVTKELYQRSFIGIIATNKQSSASYNRVLGTDIKLGIGENNSLQGFVSKSFTKGDKGNGYTWNLGFNRTSEILGLDLSYSNITGDYNPEIGFVARRDIKNLVLTGNYSYFIETNLLRKINFVPYFGYITDQNNSLESRYQSIKIELLFDSEDSFFYQHLRSLENLGGDIQFLSDYTVVANEYVFGQNEFGFSTNQSRDFYSTGSLIFGKFYNSNQIDLKVNTSAKLSNHFNFSLDYNYVEFDHDGIKSTVNLFGARVNYNFSTRLFASLLAQYNTEDKFINTNFRLEWNQATGSKLYFVINSSKNSPISRRIIDDRFEVILKYVYLFNL
jgi:hypothetical protein